MRSHTGAAIGWILGSVGLGSMTVAALLASANDFVNAHPLVTAGLGGLAASLLGVLLMVRSARATAIACARPAALPEVQRPPGLPSPPSLDWSNPQEFMYVKIKDPIYYPYGRALIAEWRIGSTRDLPWSSQVAIRSFVIELRLDGKVAGEYRYDKSDIAMTAKECPLAGNGRIQVRVTGRDHTRVDEGPGYSDSRANDGQWNVKISALVVCMLSVAGVPRDVKLAYEVEPQFCGVKLAILTQADVEGVLREP